MINTHPLIAQGRTAEIYAWETGKVLKLFRDWMPEEPAQHEAQRSRRLSETGLPVPQVYETIQVNGRHGIIYERIDGPSLLAELKRRLWRLRHYARQMADLHARLHRARVDSLPPLHGNLRWKIEHARPLPDPIKQAALAALEQLPSGDSVCHGDFHPDNILLAARGAIIIDWMDASAGHPLGDVARTLLLLQSGALPPGTSAPMRLIINLTRRTLSALYLRRYLALTGFSQADLTPWLLPVTAARLEEAIPDEIDLLLARAAALSRAGIAS